MRFMRTLTSSVSTFAQSSLFSSVPRFSHVKNLAKQSFFAMAVSSAGHQNGNLEGSHNKQDIVLHNDFYSVT